MQPADLDQVRAIELSTSASAWSKQQLQQSLDSGHVLVAENKVLGFAIVATVLDQAELHNIAIDPALQGQGLGRQLLDGMIEQLPAEVKSLYLEVRVSNIAAIRLYQQTGFVQIAERRDYYKTEFGREDALIMGLQTDAAEG
ncbi:MAG: ribosomal protein S18-alanine N-acetyltransferase [Porticoccaceae bacterium]|jgi:ribosomal-protein-alanine N-acetyltransferase|nr:ribosomal protein S18-alanine N-acetyltransferase [Porticoccaceae bacterium]